MLTAALYSLGVSAFMFLLPVFATQLLDASSVELGWLWSSLGIGMLAASVWLAWINQGDLQNRLRLVSAALAVGAIAVCTLGMLQAPIMAAVLIIIFGGSTAVFTPVVWAMLQELTPEPLLGRVFTTFSAGAMAPPWSGWQGSVGWQMPSDLQRVFWVSECCCWAPRPSQLLSVDDTPTRRLPISFRRESVPSRVIA